MTNAAFSERLDFFGRRLIAGFTLCHACVRTGDRIYDKGVNLQFLLVCADFSTHECHLLEIELY
jgi:hypothetical protein